MRRYNVPIDVDDLVKRYSRGESEKALAKVFGVSRTIIRNRLVKAGVQPRGRSEAMFIRMANTSPEERARLATAAHDAVRGKPKTPEFLLARAAGVEKQGARHGNVSPAELILASDLRNATLPVVHQKAIGPYNVDIATGTVAVEVLGGGWHRSKLHGKRLRYMLDAGWDVIYIWVDGRRSPLRPGAAQYVVAHCEFRDGNPALPRCYRVIRGGGEFVAEGSADGDDIPDVLPVSDGPDVLPAEIPLGLCQCGCGRPTWIPTRTDIPRGRVKGVPVRFAKGHGSRLRSNDPR